MKTKTKLAKVRCIEVFCLSVSSRELGRESPDYKHNIKMEEYSFVVAAICSVGHTAERV